MNVTDTRRARLKAWFAKRTLPEKEKSYLSQLIGGKASFGEKAARRLETTYGMPEKYLDMQSDEAAESRHRTIPEDLVAAWEFLTNEQQDTFIAQIKEKAEHNRAVLDQLAMPRADKTIRVSDRRKRQVDFGHEELRINKGAHDEE